jgi:hypothetical protein
MLVFLSENTNVLISFAALAVVAYGTVIVLFKAAA